MLRGRAILFSSVPQAEKDTTFSATRRAVEMIHFVHEEKLFYSRRMSSRFPDQQPNRKKTTVVPEAGYRPLR